MELINAKKLHDIAIKRREERYKTRKEEIIKKLLEASERGSTSLVVSNNFISDSFKKELLNNGFIINEGIEMILISW